MNNSFLVCVRCMTFNHAPYIEDAMNGFTMQKTTFPFVCVIMDDCSTDGEQEVIKKYLQEHFDLDDKIVVRHEETDDYTMTFAQHKENKNCFFAVYFLKYNHYSIKKKKLPYISEWVDSAKYAALCEGDDYWFVADKLEKQVQYLNSNDDCALVYTSAKGFDQQSGEFFCMKITGSTGYIYEDIISNRINIWTLTVCFRPTLYESVPKLNPDLYHCGDLLIFLHYASQAKLHYINEETAVYRRLQNSASHNKLRKIQSIFKFKVNNTRIYYLEYGPKLNVLFKEKLYKLYSIQKLPYCFYYYKWELFRECKIGINPFYIHSIPKSLKYFIIYILYKICSSRMLFNMVCKATNKFGYK